MQNQMILPTLNEIDWKKWSFVKQTRKCASRLEEHVLVFFLVLSTSAPCSMVWKVGNCQLLRRWEALNLSFFHATGKSGWSYHPPNENLMTVLRSLESHSTLQISWVHYPKDIECKINVIKDCWQCTPLCKTRKCLLI